jgi:hypothetical protein
MSANGNGHYWSKFCWRDWQHDIALRACSLEARGLWMDLLCIMHEGSPVGHLTINGRPMTIKEMTINSRISIIRCRKLLEELEKAAVFSRSENGTIFCRRMVRDAEASDIGRENADKRWHNGPSDPNGVPNGGANGDPNAKSQSQSQSKKGGPPKSPRRRGDFPAERLSVTDQIRRDWNLGSFLHPDIRDDDEPPDRRLMS